MNQGMWCLASRHQRLRKQFRLQQETGWERPDQRKAAEVLGVFEVKLRPAAFVKMRAAVPHALDYFGAQPPSAAAAKALEIRPARSGIVEQRSLILGFSISAVLAIMAISAIACR